MLLSLKTKKTVITSLLFLAIANPNNIQAIRLMPLGGACITGSLSCVFAALSIMSYQLLNLPNASAEEQAAFFATSIGASATAKNTIQHWLSKGEKYEDVGLVDRIRAIQKNKGKCVGSFILYLISAIPFSYATYRGLQDAFAEEQQEKA